MIRQAVFAGSFYPADRLLLKQTVNQLMDQATPDEHCPKALIVPHAGYQYSGAIAASAYTRLRTVAAKIKRVVLLGPAHRLGFHGLALSQAEFFQTPLGRIAIDRDAGNLLRGLEFVSYLEAAHAQEHSLEVQLPFLQSILDHFSLIPIVAGSLEPDQVAQVLERLWGGAETLIVISSDLSHYHDYQTARELDGFTNQLIEGLQYERLSSEAACGQVPIAGLLHFLRQHCLSIRNIDLRNSGDTSGDKRRVVGYGAYVVD